MNNIQKKPTKRIFSEPRCGPIGASISLSLPQSDVDAPQPIIDRRPSLSLFKWGSSQKRNDAPTPTARQGLIRSYKNIHTTHNQPNLFQNQKNQKLFKHCYTKIQKKPEKFIQKYLFSTYKNRHLSIQHH